MEIDNLTTDELLSHIPPDETDVWEYKSADTLVNKGALKSELSKQVSAFANSGGGYLIFGFDHKTRQFEPCQELFGREPTKDYLSTLVETSVSFEIQTYRIARVPFTNDPNKAVFLIRIGDSPAAPHQASDKVYYYRIDGHSKPAPHFHVELLRRRETKSVLAIDKIRHRILGMSGDNPSEKGLLVRLQISLRNVSFQCATNWGVIIETDPPDVRWTGRGGAHGRLRDGVCVEGRGVLLPRGVQTLSPELTGTPTYGPTQSGIRDMWEQLSLKITPVSQNYVGQPEWYGWRDDPRAFLEADKLEQELSRL